MRSLLGCGGAIAILRFGDVRSLFEGLGKCDRYFGFLECDRYFGFLECDRYFEVWRCAIAF
ncbi:MAG: hypothetical protein ACKO99_11425 [Dolichospermum sp.]